MDGESGTTVEVPRALLEQLVSYLGADREEGVEVPGNGRWTRPMVVRLRSELDNYRGALALVDLAAERAGSLVTLDEVEARCGLARTRIRSDLAAMTKAVRRLFAVKAWPLRAMQTSRGMNYLMDARIAEWWRSCTTAG